MRMHMRMRRPAHCVHTSQAPRLSHHLSAAVLPTNARTPSAKKRLAVPYRAADVASPRGEFSQPDVALIYTHLAYYGDGLSRGEFRQAVQMLLSRGASERAYYFNRWLAHSRTSGTQAAGAGAGRLLWCVLAALVVARQTWHRCAAHEISIRQTAAALCTCCCCCAGATAAFDSVDKLDPNNTQLMSAMWSFFSHNMEVIHYWLATCVLPQETKQYAGRLEATAWHLAHNPAGNTAGFSGTNDSHRLLPMQVQQVSLDAAPELEGTNGKMVAMLLQHAAYLTLPLPAAAAAGAEVRSAAVVAPGVGGHAGAMSSATDCADRLPRRPTPIGAACTPLLLPAGCQPSVAAAAAASAAEGRGRCHRLWCAAGRH
jgi:hypothetical protein